MLWPLTNKRNLKVKIILFKTNKQQKQQQTN